MAYATDIETYWQTALPSIPLFYGLAPSGTALPYAVFFIIGTSSTFMSCPSYWETCSFQVSYFSTSLEDCETKCQTIMDAFDMKQIATGAMINIRGNFVMQADTSTQKKVYQGIMTWDYLKNRTLA